MRLRKLLCFVSSVCLCCLIVFSGMSIDAKAYDLPTGTTHITADTLRSWIGDTVKAQYLGADGEYHTTTATYANPQYIAGANIAGLTASDYNGRSMIWYLVPYPQDSMTAYSFSPVCIIQPEIHLSNVSYIDFGFCFHMSNKALNVSYSTAQPYGYMDYYYNGRDRLYAGEGASGNLVGHLGSFQVVGSNLYGGNIRKLESSATDFYIGDVSAVCGGTFNGGLLLGIGLLDIIVNSDYVLEENAPLPPGGGGDTPSGSSSGTVTGTISDNGDGTQDVNITIEQDNTGLLSGLKDILASVFIPSQEYMNSWHEEIEDSFQEHLGGVAQAVTLIDEQADYLRAATSADYVYFPELTLPIGDSGGSAARPLIGADYTLIEGRQVELRPARDGKLKVLWDFVEFAVDVVCVLAVFNMLQTKYEIFLNPDGEVIDYDN